MRNCFRRGIPRSGAPHIACHASARARPSALAGCVCKAKAVELQAEADTAPRGWFAPEMQLRL